MDDTGAPASLLAPSPPKSGQIGDDTRRDLNALLAKIDLKRLAPAA